MEWIIRKFFCLFARLCILRHKPFVIGVTGSFGKTTARNLISDILQKSGKDVYTPAWNYNGEWWLAFAVLRIRSGKKNLFQGVKMMLWAFATIFSSKYPRILVLEYGVDHIGEMDIQLDIVEPDIALITTLSPSHIEWFGTEDLYYAEKKKICRWKKTRVVVNADDPHQVNFPSVLRYGCDAKNTDMKILSVNWSLSGLDICCIFQGKELILHSPFLGKHLAHLITGVYSVATLVGLDHEEIQQHIMTSDMPYGRGNILHGIQSSIVIDGTYNGGFEPIVSGVKMLVHLWTFEKRKTIALIGDMRELWNLETERHVELWKNLLEISVDYYVFVWKVCSSIIRPLVPASWQEKIFFTLDSREAGEYIREVLLKNSEPYLIFAKGSQNTIFLEEALKKIILPEECAKLVRQDEVYLEKKKQHFSKLEWDI